MGGRVMDGRGVYFRILAQLLCLRVRVVQNTQNVKVLLL